MIGNQDAVALTRRAANDKVHLALPGHALHLPAVVVHPLEHVVAVLVEDVLAVGMVGPVGVGGRLVVLDGPLALDFIYFITNFIIFQTRASNAQWWSSLFQWEKEGGFLWSGLVEKKAFSTRSNI